MVNNHNNQSLNICFQCGSKLILVSQEKVELEGMHNTQINTVYLCSNAECQKKKDKEKVDRMKMRQNKEVAEKERLERIQELRKSGKKVKTQEG